MVSNNTTALHLFTNVAFTAMVLLFWYLPAIYKKYSSYSSILIWVIILPMLMFISGSYKLSLTGEDKFVALKIIYLIVLILFIHTFLWVGMNDSNRFINKKNLTRGVLILIGGNILLAVQAQYDNRCFQVEEVDKVLDTWNPILGAILAAIVFILAFVGREQDQFGVDGLRIYSRLGWWYIMAHSLWDTVFRFQLDQSTVVSLFIVMTIIAPAALYYMTSGWVDYAQFRSYTLLFYIIVILGIGEGDFNIFPAYNETGFDVISEAQSPITKLLKNENFRWAIFGLTVFSTGGAVVETFKGTKNFLMNRNVL